MAFYLGIDIGGTKIKAVLLKGLKKQRPRLFVIDTPKNKKNFFVKLEELIVRVTARLSLKDKIYGIGVGVAGLVDRKRVVVVKAANLPFLNGWDVKKFLRKFRAPVKVDNDARCFTKAEEEWGAAKRYKNVVGIAVGTGIGGGIMIDGKMYYGRTGAAGEVGHQILRVKSLKFKVKSYEWEELAGRRAFLKYGDRSEIVGVGVANLINALDPDVVVLGGGGVTSGVVKLGTVRKVAREYVVSPLARKTPIVKGKLGYAAQAVGAALLCGVN